MPSNTSLYTTVAQSNVGGNNLTTLYNTSASQIATQLPYGNANVQRFLNNGTDGANTIQNVVANGIVSSQGANISNGSITFSNINPNIAQITVVGNIANNQQSTLRISGSPINDLTNQGNAAGAVAGLTAVTGGVIGLNQARISNTTYNLSGGGLQLSGGSVFGNINTGRNVQGGNTTITSGAVVSRDANNVTTGSLAIVAGQATFTVANNVRTGGTNINSGSVVPNTASGPYTANTVSFGDILLSTTTMSLPSNGNIGNIKTGNTTFGATFGVGVTLQSNSSNIVVGEMSNVSGGGLFLRTAGIGQSGTVSLNNIANVNFGNVATDNIVIGTGFWRYPAGSNISNVTVNNFTSGNITLVTGHATNVSSVTNSYQRGNIILNANAIVLQANATGNTGGTGTFTFYSNNTADLGNNVVANNFTGNLTGNLNITNVVIGGTITGNLIPSANVTYDLGNTTHRWRDIYLANNSIYLGNALLSANGTSLVVDNLIVTNTGTNGIGNVASLALNGNALTVLAGDGTFVPYNIYPAPQDLPIYGRTQTINIYSLLNETIPMYGRTQTLFISSANNEVIINGRSSNISVYL